MRSTILLIILTAISTNIKGQEITDNQLREYQLKSDPFTPYEILLDNPCKDEMYLKLKEIDINEMTDREFEIFKQKDQACNEFLKAQEETAAEKKNAETLKKSTDAYGVLIGISLVATLIGTIYYLSI